MLSLCCASLRGQAWPAPALAAPRVRRGSGVRAVALAMMRSSLEAGGGGSVPCAAHSGMSGGQRSHHHGLGPADCPRSCRPGRGWPQRRPGRSSRSPSACGECCTHRSRQPPGPWRPLAAKSSRDHSTNSSAEPGLLIDCWICIQSQAARKKPAVYSLGSRGRHPDRNARSRRRPGRRGPRPPSPAPVSQLRVVMLRQREPGICRELKSSTLIGTTCPRLSGFRCRRRTTSGSDSQRRSRV